MVATVGAAVLTSIVPPSRVTPADPTPRPMSATASGRPAATTEPKATMRMTSAAATPASSPVPFIVDSVWLGSSPPSSASRPASRSG